MVYFWVLIMAYVMSYLEIDGIKRLKTLIDTSCSHRSTLLSFPSRFSWRMATSPSPTYSRTHFSSQSLFRFSQPTFCISWLLYCSLTHGICSRPSFSTFCSHQPTSTYLMFTPSAIPMISRGVPKATIKLRSYRPPLRRRTAKSMLAFQPMTVT